MIIQVGVNNEHKSFYLWVKNNGEMIFDTKHVGHPVTDCLVSSLTHKEHDGLKEKTSCKSNMLNIVK